VYRYKYGELRPIYGEFNGPVGTEKYLLPIIRNAAKVPRTGDRLVK